MLALTGENYMANTVQQSILKMRQRSASVALALVGMLVFGVTVTPATLWRGHPRPRADANSMPFELASPAAHPARLSKIDITAMVSRFAICAPRLSKCR
jgi:hypothetical protein